MKQVASLLSGALLCALLVESASRLLGQSPAADAKPPAFDVASVKPNKSGESTKGGMRFQPGRLTATNYTLRELIQSAGYLRGGSGAREILGGPGWIGADRFDVVATGDFTLAGFLPDANGSAGLAYRMLQTLLAERFRLRVHSETRQLPVFALVTAKRDGALGPGLRRSDFDCDAMLAAIAKGGRLPAPPEPGKRPPCSRGGTAGRFGGTAVSMAELADALAPFTGRPVIDGTGLPGRFDFEREWTPPPSDDGLAIFTALQEQLGLKLNSQRGPVEVLVVDRAERPIPD